MWLSLWSSDSMAIIQLKSRKDNLEIDLQQIALFWRNCSKLSVYFYTDKRKAVENLGLLIKIYLVLVSFTIKRKETLLLLLTFAPLFPFNHLLPASNIKPWTFKDGASKCRDIFAQFTTLRKKQILSMAIGIKQNNVWHFLAKFKLSYLWKMHG